MKPTTSISSSCLKNSRIFLNRLKAIFTLQAFVLAMSISTASADVEFGEIIQDFLIPFPDSKITAQHVTTTLLPQLIGSDDQLRQRLGFSSHAQIDNLLLPDRPFVVLHVGLSRLKHYNASSPFSPLLEDKNWFKVSSSPSRVRPVRFLYPIRESSRPSSGCTPSSLVDTPSLGCIASSVQVKRLSGTWEFQQIGRPGLIKKLTHYGNGATHFVLWIPVLNLHYLATFGLTDLEITAITDDRYVKDGAGNLIKAGDKRSGEQVFKQLKNVVETIDTISPPG